jgi:ectoine hydroxylase-related dioxygenase (phytanoyl-CoA dioxygenase family)
VSLFWAALVISFIGNIRIKNHYIFSIVIMKDILNLQLNNEQINTFQQQGFLSLKQITTAQEIERLKAIYDRLVEQMTEYLPEKIALLADRQALPLAGGTEILVWIPSPELVMPKLIDTIYFRNALKIAADLLQVEETQIIGRVRLYLKPAYFGAEMPWHQDAAYPGAIDCLKIWMPLDAATPENGCLHFIPGSHLGGIIPHHSYEGDPSGCSLRAEGAEALPTVVCPLAPGGATVHHSHTLHYSNANKTAQQRRALVISCRVSDIQ